MKISLTTAQAKLHEGTVALSRQHRQLEAQLVVALQEVDRTRLWRHLDCTSSFQYAVRELGLSEPVAYAFLAVARKAATIQALSDAIAERRLSVSLASRIVGCLTVENATEVIEYAVTHTRREVDWDVARRSPKDDAEDREQPTARDRIKLTVTVSREAFEKIKRVQSLEASCGRGLGLERALEAAAEEYLERRDPVRKAARARKTEKPKPEQPAAASELCSHRHKLYIARVPLTAAQRHAVHARDGGRCAHVGESRKRCGADRWVDVHHVHPVSRGGGNELSNLTTLCSVHHDLIHQTSFPIDGQVSWLRAGSVEYARV